MTARTLAVGGILTVILAAAAIGIWVGEARLGGFFARAEGAPVWTLAKRAASLALVAVAAYVLWRRVDVVVARLEAAEGDSRRDARLRTLLPLGRGIARIALAVVVALVALSELGIDIAPLLASIGIIGLAVGFGAQSLVKDVITGAFILLEDSIAVGDVVEVGTHSGVVEGMTLRTVRLRDLAGDLHIVPFGDVGAVRNMTRDFSYALIDAGVAYKENVDHVIPVMREAAKDMRCDANYGADILAPLEVLGVNALADSAVEIRVRLKTRPGRQWRVRREYLRRMKQAFDAHGIEIPFPHRTLIMGDAQAAPSVAPVPPWRGDVVGPAPETGLEEGGSDG